MEKKFVPGLNVFPKSEKSPDFVMCKLSLNPEKLGAFLAKQSDQYISVDILVSRDGKPYAALNTWKPKQAEPKQDDEDSLPF